VKHRSVIALLLTLFATSARADWPLIGPEATPTPAVVQPDSVFTEVDMDWSGVTIETDARALASVAQSTSDYLWRSDLRSDHSAPHGMRDELGITPQDVRDTLAFITRVASEDVGRPGQRLEDADFLSTHFRVLKWSGDREQARANGVAVSGGRVRITKYLVYQHFGSAQPTATHNTGLYGIPAEEEGLSLEQADAQPDLLRHHYTRSQVLDGVFGTGGVSAGLAPALVWMRRQDIHEALMQGTVELTLAGGITRTFNVHRSNGIPYVHGERNPERQDRFWYFREVDGVRGWGQSPEDKIQLQAEAAVAGDARNLGLGGLFAIRATDGFRLVVLADTGGAFEPNLYQLDFFAGAFPHRATFDRAVAPIPARAEVYLLVRR
jgi:hypothetical protein